mmetsp:Transcript_125391/g.287218  ORF Transcript_125391/g.287218 Transcript_125391/m.287218 type:complete len:375 (+) Transcript_125391:88-1212(+)
MSSLSPEIVSLLGDYIGGDEALTRLCLVCRVWNAAARSPWSAGGWLLRMKETWGLERMGVSFSILKRCLDGALSPEVLNHFGFQDVTTGLITPPVSVQPWELRQATLQFNTSRRRWEARSGAQMLALNVAWWMLRDESHKRPWVVMYPTLEAYDSDDGDDDVREEWAWLDPVEDHVPPGRRHFQERPVLGPAVPERSLAARRLKADPDRQWKGVSLHAAVVVPGKDLVVSLPGLDVLGPHGISPDVLCYCTHVLSTAAAEQLIGGLVDLSHPMAGVQPGMEVEVPVEDFVQEEVHVLFAVREAHYREGDLGLDRTGHPRLAQVRPCVPPEQVFPSWDCRPGPGANVPFPGEEADQELTVLKLGHRLWWPGLQRS